jgi:ribose/xylose/arabinose/galactoside ABC-type transport system permease subunit
LKRQEKSAAKLMIKNLVTALLRFMHLVVPLVILAVMLEVNPALRTLHAWDRIGRSWAAVLLLAIGLTPVIITGGIDLSVGSVMGLSAVVAGFLLRDAGLPIGAALLGSLLLGAAAGSLNGGLVLAGINPLVVTLATLGVFRGLAYGLCGANRVDDFPSGLQDWWEGSWLSVPHPIWVVLAVFVVMFVFLHHTWMGRMIYAMGDNVRTARYAGVPVRTLTFVLYAQSGFLAGLAGLASICEFRSAPPNQGEGMELQAIACVVLGGVRITGGAGHLAGTFLGTLTLAALLEGLAGVRASGRTVLLGAFVVAVAIANEISTRARLEAPVRS